MSPLLESKYSIPCSFLKCCCVSGIENSVLKDNYIKIIIFVMW